jgi:hypothetical protein
VKVSEIYSTCLKAADLNGQDLMVTIKGGSVRAVDDGKRKIFLEFEETGAPLALNVTNARTIARLHGEEATQWKGKQITLFPTTTQFGAREVDCIRIRDRVSQPAASAQQTAPVNGGTDTF